MPFLRQGTKLQQSVPPTVFTVPPKNFTFALLPQRKAGEPPDMSFMAKRYALPSQVKVSEQLSVSDAVVTTLLLESYPVTERVAAESTTT